MRSVKAVFWPLSQAFFSPNHAIFSPPPPARDTPAHKRAPDARRRARKRRGQLCDRSTILLIQALQAGFIENSIAERDRVGRRVRLPGRAARDAIAAQRIV